MNCETWQDKIDAFVDAELVAEEARAFEAHMRSCPACAAETAARQRLKLETRLAGQRFAPTPAFEASLRRRVAPKRARWVWLPALASAAAVLIIGVILGLNWRDRVIQQQLVSQLADQHIATLASTNPVDVISTDKHTVKPWFAGRVPFSVDLPELSGTQFELLGGRVSYVQQVPAAQLLFGVRKHRVSVFLFRETAASSALGSDAAPVRRAGFNTATWKRDDIRYFVISDVDPADVRQLCGLLQRATVD